MIIFLVCCAALGAAVENSCTYFYLIYQGYSRKEMRSVEKFTGKKVRCQKLLQGIINLVRFYFDYDLPESEFSKEFSLSDTNPNSHKVSKTKRVI